ncbi:hypothetical protein P7L78_12925 [Tistrella bauzanensis]|jgi:hypothetical protein|uniref:Uncharacterized protein n=1 Tax=Tistrella arctica TaxID=3133430 RepID=A0ABU9YI46_9PROT
MTDRAGHEGVDMTASGQTDGARSGISPYQGETAAQRRERMIRFISSQPLPIMPMSVSIGSDGEFKRNDSLQPLRFTFRWRNIAYTGTLRNAPEGVFLSLIADLGVLPYSAEAPERRQRYLSLVGRKSWSGRTGIGVEVTNRQHIVVVNQEQLMSPPYTANAIVGEVARLALTAAPVVNWLHAEIAPDKAEPDAAAPGRSAGPRQRSTRAFTADRRPTDRM